MGPQTNRLVGMLLTTWLLPICVACVGGTADASSDDTVGTGIGQESPMQTVRTGVDVLLTDSIHLVSGKRVGLISNHTGEIGRAHV